MTTRLDPPQVPPLTTTQRSRLRQQVMDRTRSTPGTTRRWLAPAVAVGAVAAVVAGTLAVTHQDVGNPDAASTGITTATPSQRASLEVVPAAEAAAVFAKSCRLPQTNPKAPLDVIWARRVPGMTAKNTDMLMLVRDSARPGSADDHGVAACMTKNGKPSLAAQPVPTNKPLTRKEGLSALTGGSSSTTTPTAMTELWMFYRARPEIARLESRIVVKGVAGPWQQGFLDDGYAYTVNRINATTKGSDMPTQELRAYDAQSRLIPIKPN